ncbi:MAG TPA: ATP-binding protein [Chryseosolibacter sp.]
MKQRSVEAELILSNIPGSHLILLPAEDFTIIAATDDYLKATFTTRDEIIGRPVFDVFTDSEVNEQGVGARNLRASLQQVVCTKQAQAMADQRYDVLDRSKNSFEFKVWKPVNKPVLDQHGALLYIIHTVEDVTELALLRKEGLENRQKLAESENRFRSMIADAPAAMMLIRGIDATIDCINEHMLHLIHKVDMQGVEGRNLLDILPEVRHQGAYKMMLEVMRTGVASTGHELIIDFVVDEVSVRNYINLSYTPVLEGGAIVGVLHVAVDVTEQVEQRLKVEENANLLQQKVSERTEELERKNKQLEQFTYAASHDLQEPLRKVTFFANRLTERNQDQLDEAGRAYLRKIGISAARMKLIIDDLLAYSHQTRTPDELEPVNLHAIVMETLEELDLVIEQKGALVKVETLPTVFGERTQMHQLFYNLLSNALKFARKDVWPEITVRSSPVIDKAMVSTRNLDPSKDYVLIEIADNGIGFETAYAEQIFELFRRLHHTSAYEGTGIGLALAKKIVENHGGVIWAESQNGAVFKILLRHLDRK